MKILAIVALLVGSLQNGKGVFQNPPLWPHSVYVFKPEQEQDYIQATIENASENLTPLVDDCKHGQFSTDRVAFLFTPGNYSNVDVQVGYYTQVLGLGERETDTVLSVRAGCVGTGELDLDTFWRGAENFRTHSDLEWHVSQAGPLRKVYVNGRLGLSGGGYGCAGYASDLYVEKSISFGAQLQYSIATSHIHGEQTEKSKWATLFMGNTFDKYTVNATNRVTKFDASPKIAGKPFIISAGDKFSLKVPGIHVNVTGQTSQFDNDARTIDFSQVYVVRSKDVDWEKQLRTAMNHPFTRAVLFTPGIYEVESEIKITRDDFVVLGIGMATLSLASTTANHVLKIEGAKNVRVAGLLIETSVTNDNAVLFLADQESNNTIIQDVFFRVGGPVCEGVSAKTMLQVDASDSIIENTWAWRAGQCKGPLGNNKLLRVQNHPVPVENKSLPVQHGIVVGGANIIGYALSSEHTLKQNLIWSGENGTIYSYQSEIAPDIDQDDVDNTKITGYKVDDNVTSHQAHGTGVYIYFRDDNVTLPNGYQCPNGKERTFFHNSFTLRLGGTSMIEHIVNQVGGAVTQSFTPVFLNTNL